MQSEKNAMVVYPCSRLAGEISLQGAKNSVLPIMAAAVANRGVTVLHNCPEIADVYTMAALLKECGCVVDFKNHVMTIDAKNADNGLLHSSDSTRMRASILLMGSCLGRFGQFSMPSPGGCAIGKRPVNFHVDAMNSLGASVCENEDGVSGSVSEGGLIGGRITLPFPSVGATQNVLLAASCASGGTELLNASKEPEIWDLCDYLRMLGADIQGERTGHIRIVPKGSYEKDVRFIVPADRIVAGTILTAVAGTTGNVYINNIDCDRIECVISLLKARADSSGRGVILNIDRRAELDCVISTGPFPEFPTDMQSIFLALMAVSGGFCIMEENIFDTRFNAAYELNRLGADIRTEGKLAYVYGRRKLNGGTVTAGDLRGGAALVVAGLFADEPVMVRQCHYIHRGYENLAGDLCRLGAVITENKEE